MSKASLRQVSDDILNSGSNFSAAIVIALQSTFSSCASCTLCSTFHIVIALSPLLVYVALCATRAPNMMINLYVGGLLLARLAGRYTPAYCCCYRPTFRSSILPFSLVNVNYRFSKRNHRLFFVQISLNQIQT